jgi:methionine-rich copper-binding protein CopC
MRRNLAIILISSLLLFLAACGGTSHPAISVASTVPATGATSVSTTAAIQITFSGAANPNTVNSTNIQVTDSNHNPVAGTVTYNSTTSTATFTPSTALAANMTYTVTVTAIASSGGNAMTTPFTTTFTTAASSTSSAQYQSPLFGSANSSNGQVSLDTSGNVTVQLTGATAGTTFSVQFCPAALVNSSITYSCFSVGTVTSDASGNANTTMTFPQSGSWAGDFQLLTGTTVDYSTTIAGTGASQTYLSQLEPTTTVNGKGLEGSGAQDPLTSGSITLSAGALQYTLTGAAPNTAYSAGECLTIAIGDSSCYELYTSQNQGAFTTDANGNVTFSVLDDGEGGDMLQAFSSSGKAGFIGGFTVP